jgi:molybdenum cofactor sulfurtransferase
MDIPAHILDAVTTASDLSHPPPARIPSAKSSVRKSRSEPRFARSRSARSSTENLSVSSESEQEHGYQTDFTSIPSEAAPEDMPPDDVEAFREREYPQLKGKTYLDHGGTTVG